MDTSVTILGEKAALRDDDRSAEIADSGAIPRLENEFVRVPDVLRGSHLMRKSRILIVDDDAAILETMAELLELSGFSPVQATDAAEALMILQQDPDIDAMVTDLTMPGADGITLIRHARELKSHLPAILLTGYAEQLTSVATCAAGNFHVLSKPVPSDRLLAQLEVLLAQR